MGAEKARQRLIQEIDNDSTERLHQNWQVICSMMVPVCPIMVSVSTFLSLSLSPAPFVSWGTVCLTPHQVTRCPTMPHYQLVRLRKPGKLMSKVSSEAAAQLTLGHCCVRINEFFSPSCSYGCVCTWCHLVQ